MATNRLIYDRESDVHDSDNRDNSDESDSDYINESGSDNIDIDESESESDDVEVVAGPHVLPDPVVGANQNQNQEEEEVMMIGVVGLLLLPHAREHCTIHPYDPSNNQARRRHCAHCYCYICQIPAEGCHYWRMHAHASERFPVWRELRLNWHIERDNWDNERDDWEH
jgi:hypothetical protein